MVHLLNLLFETRPKGSECEHQMESANVGAGLERSVCGRCGEIKLRYLDSGLAWDRSA